jgi:hypothetical protein
MIKFIKILPIILLLISNIKAEPKQLINFVQLLDALSSGNRVNTVIHYKDCSLVSGGKESKPQDQIGGMDMQPFEYYAEGVIGKNKAFISVSQTVMVYLAGFNGYLYHYIKLRAYEDNTVEITSRYLTTDSMQVQMDEKYTGEINDGSNGKAIYFFSN